MPSQTRAGLGVRILFSLAALVTCATVVMGTLVCSTDSSSACPNWPGCYVGQLGPKAELNPVIEFVHRVVAVSCGPLLLVAALVGLKALRGAAKLLPWLALAGALAAGIFGMMTIKHGISTTQAALDLGASLIAVAAITRASAILQGHSARTARGFGLALLLAFAYHVTSVFTAGPGSLTRCLSWPVWRILDADGPRELQWARLVLAAAAALAIVVASGVARGRGAVRVLLDIAILAVVGLSVLLAQPAPQPWVRVAAAIGAAVLWCLLCAAAARSRAR